MHIAMRRARAVAALLLGIASLGLGLAHANPGQQPEKSSRLSINGSTRMRVEGIDGQFRPAPAGDDQMVSFRTLVLATLDLDVLTLSAELDDARIYGQGLRSSAGGSESNAIEPIQAYARLALGAMPRLGGHGTLTLGRFTYEAGSNRLVERADFANSPATFLGANLEWKNNRGDRFVGIVSRPFERLPATPSGLRGNHVELDRASAGLSFSGLSYTRAKLLGNASGEAFGYWLDEHDTPGRSTRDRHLFTFGGRLYSAPARNALDFDFDAALQHGRARATSSAADLVDRRVRAGMIHAETGWTFGVGWTPRVAVMIDYASGDGPGADYNRFDGLFGSRRADFGPLGLYGPMSRANLFSPGISLEGKPTKTWDFFVKGRLLQLAEATDSFGAAGVRDKSGLSGKTVGAQMEVRGRKWLLAKKLRWEFGAAHLFKGHFLSAAPNAPRSGDTNYGYSALSAFF